MQELITHYPELYSLVVEYAKEPNLLLLCKASHQIIMQRRLYNTVLQNFKYNLVGPDAEFQLNLRNQLHGVCVINFDFGTIEILYCENQLVEVKLSGVVVPLLDLKDHIWQGMPAEKVSYKDHRIGYGDTTIYFHKNGVISTYLSGCCSLYFRENFTLKKHDLLYESIYYWGNNTFREL